MLGLWDLQDTAFPFLFTFRSDNRAKLQNNIVQQHITKKDMKFITDMTRIMIFKVSRYF